MSEVENLINEKENALSVALHRFVLLKDSYPNAFYYFIEGKDAPYYLTRIKAILDSHECFPLKCGNKEKTIKMYHIISSNPLYNKYKKAYFVDRDFDDNSNLPVDIYVTPCYSIENLYCTDKVLKEILKCEFDILPSEQEFHSILQFFSEEQATFHSATLLFNAWYACIKSKGIKMNVCLDDKFPKEFVTLNISNIISSYDINSIKDKYPDVEEVSADEIEYMKDKLMRAPTFNFRGKYEIQFFYEFVKYLIEDGNNKNRQLYIKKRTKLNLDKAQLLSQLSQYALTPDSLIEYIKNIA